MIMSTNIPKWTLPLLQTRIFGELGAEEAWETIENFTQGQKEWDNPPNIISEQEVASLRAQAKRLFGNENVWVEMHSMASYEQPSCLGSTIISKALRKSDQMHQTFEKSYLAMTHKLNDMIKLPKSQPKKTYKENLECEMVMVKIPKCMSWLDAYNEPIGDLDMMEDKMDNPSPHSTP
ncbi:hypothetical protein Tco_1135815 [Tanacetum coccineum]